LEEKRLEEENINNYDNTDTTNIINNNSENDLNNPKIKIMDEKIEINQEREENNAIIVDAKEKNKESEKTETNVVIESQKKKEEHKAKEKTNDDEEIAIDFTKTKERIIGFFKTNKKSSKNKHKEEHHSHHHEKEQGSGKKDSEEISIDFKEVGNVFKKNAKWVIPILLIFIAIFVSSYFRMMPSELPITDDWAENSVNNFYKQQIQQQINQQYPNLPAQNKGALVEKELQNFLKENKDLVKQQTEATSQEYKNYFKDDSGQTYLLAIDPYYWFAESRNYVENGQLGDGINSEGEKIFSLRNGREDKSITQLSFHPLFQGMLFKMLSFFNRDLTLLRVSFLLPAILIALSLIPAFFIGRKIAGNVGGFFAAIIIAINSALLGRTPAGFSDTDPYNILFPLIIAWLFLESYTIKEKWKKISALGLAGLFTGFYAISWGGWHNIVNFIVYAAIAYLLYQTFIHRSEFKKGVTNFFKNKEIKNTLLVLFTYIISSGVFVTLFKSFKDFIRIPLRPFQFIFLKDVAVKSIWPNVLTTVAEFNEIAFSNIVSQMGGTLLFFIGILGIILTFINKNKEGDRKIHYAIFLTLWFIGTAYSFTQGIRFSILLVPAFAISFGAAIGIIYQWTSSWLNKELKLSKYLAKGLVLLIFCLLLISPITSAENIAKSEIPSMNDAWYGTLTKIKNTSADAIITSWWDFGHWFYAISERKVTFDGGDQGERIHWVGKTLLTDDEQLSIGLLRMLNCGQEKPVHTLEKFLEDDAVKAVNILNEIMIINDKKEAIKILKNEGLATEQIAEVIKLTYCEDLIDQYYITSEDMVGKAGVWGHFGSWDFNKALMYQTVSKNQDNGKQILIEQFGLNEEAADQYYYNIINTDADRWIAPWPGYHTGLKGCDFVSESLISCSTTIQGQNVNFLVELNTYEVSLENNQGIVPNSIVYATKEGIKEKKIEGQKMGSSFVLVPNGNGYKFMITDPLQANSMFTKLFYFEGHGLKCFNKFDDQQQITGGGRIITWTVDFNCQQENNIFFLPKPLKEEINAAHILVSTEDKSDEEALILIQEIKDQVTINNFAELAKKYSQDSGSAVNGGNLGWFGKGLMVPEFEEATFSLNVGDISEPIKTQFGYHLIHLIDKRTS
jgi:dolichyl-phosphooligosaccharide-protein glycotransferase